MLLSSCAINLIVVWSIASTWTLAGSLHVDTNQSLEPLCSGTLDRCPVPPAFSNVSGTAPDECTTPIPHTCTFYLDCLQARLHCPQSGYPIAYGWHFCTKFQRQLGEFTPRGRAWVLRTMTCLQTSLVPILPELLVHATSEGGEEDVCDLLKDRALDSHPHCYVASGVCDLRAVKDFAQIVGIVGLRNLLTEQAVETGLMCLKRWTGLGG
ncbi:hypothetical protein BKA62DRAFT_713040 [Auriculariales sp. MPI-PUGE-AT-0066]|nr:hypothetical protein BKA62DRAFT_713040 [Auriculariales sp. MPI-PUGE-AT-0066]